MSLNREKLEKKFNEEYNRLNEQQRQAVDRIEGPVMVIAGPGTGKTQILASRIGKILLDTDALPANILCLTYTDAGVVAMRKRLLQFIGPDAYKVNIYTFHAFCNDVIQENLSWFEKTSLDPVSDLEKIQLFKELIDTFPRNHPLKRYRGDVYYEIRNLDTLFSTMKKEGWTPAFITSKIEEYLADLPLRDEFIYKRKFRDFKPGDLKQEKLAEEKERMEKLRAAVGEFDRFQQLMRSRNRYDFDDMINWVISAFSENKNLLADYQERYLYILVDEYQDTSGTQNRLVELLISYWDKPNVFVVGDDDQSIYRFQGANVENMNLFRGTYKDDLLTVVLTNNYRSVQSILDISKTLIGRNQERLISSMEGLSKDLIASNTALKDLEHAPRIFEYESQKQEMVGIVITVQQLLKQGLPPGRIAIIYKENKYGTELSGYFNLLGIPVFSKRKLNILELPLPRQILLLIKFLTAEHDVTGSGDEMLFEILHFTWFGIPPIEIARLSMEAAERRLAKDNATFRMLLHEKATSPPRDLFSKGLHENLVKASAIIEQLIADVSNLTLQQLFESIIRKAGVLKHIMQQEDKHWQLQVLGGLFDFIKEETHRRPLMNLAELTSLIELMEKEELELPLVQVSGSDKGVNLLTAHGAKGLEFQYVLFAGCNSVVWEKKRKPGGGFKLPDTMFPSQPSGDKDEELRRLFYVALTRAEQHLYLSYSKFRDDGKELEPSMFIAEIRDVHPINIESVEIDREDLAKFASLHFLEHTAPEIEAIEKEVVDRALDRFVMNVTALNNFLRCPLEFYFKNLIRIPSPRNDATEFGSAVHFALERLFAKMKASVNNVFPSREEFINDFEWHMNRHRESFTREQFQRRIENGQIILTSYYDKYVNTFNKVVVIEHSIRNVLVNQVPIKGKLDKLEFDGKSVNVVDYKTGDPDKAITKLKGPTTKDALGGDYWRQAVFYKILVDNYGHKDWKAASTEFDFIEPDKKKNYRREKVIISPGDIDVVTRQITETWARIQARDFYKGCGKDECHWCRFVKTNDLAIALHEINDEDEDPAPVTNEL